MSKYLSPDQKYVKTAQVRKYRYTVENGKVKTTLLSEDTANFIDDTTFHIKDFWDADREFKLNKWEFYHMSSNAYDFDISILADDDVSNYKVEVQTIILENLGREIQRLSNSMKAIAEDK